MKKYDFLFVCSANVGRSQIAEGFYNYYTGGKNSISAASLKDVGAQYNFKPHYLITKVMLEKGINISSFNVKMLKKEMIRSAKKIIVFCLPEQCPHYLRTSPKTTFKYCKDPANAKNKLSTFRKTRDQLKREILKLLTQ